MSNKKYICLCFSIFLFLIKIECLSQSIPKLRIDPATAYGGEVSDFFDNVDYIPLETTKESLFGDIRQLVVTDSSFVIYDDDTKTVLFFTRDGKFITKIKQRADTGSSIWYDKENSNISIICFDFLTQKTETKYFNIWGVSINTATAPLSIRTTTEILPLADGYFVTRKGCYLPQGGRADDSIYYLINIYKGNTLYKKFLPYSQKKNPGACSWGGGFVQSIHTIKNGTFYISTPLDHYVYKINKDTAIKIYQFVFPANRSFPDRVIKGNDKSIIDSMWNRVFLDSRKILSVGNIAFYQKHLLFKINTAVILHATNTQSYNFIYDTSTHKLISIERINPDKESYYLPIVDRDSYRTQTDGLIFNDGCLYTDISSLKMFSARAGIKLKSPQYPLVLQEYFKKQNRKSNPVIVRMKLKDF